MASHGYAPYEESSTKSALRAVLAGLAAGSKVPQGAGFLQSIGTGVAEGLGQRSAAEEAAQNYAMKQMQAQQAEEDRTIRNRYIEAQMKALERPAKEEKPPKKEDWERTKEEQDAIISFNSRLAKAVGEAKPKSTQEPLVVIQGPDGSTTYVPRSQAVGKSPATKPKMATGAEKKDLAFFDIAKTSNETADKLEDKIAKLSIPQQFQLRAPNALQTRDMQVYNQAKRAFIEAKLRQVSGAAISQGEYDSYDRIYFAQPGDSKEVRDNKRALRKQVIGGLKYSAGKAYEEFYGEDPAPISGFDPEAARQKYGY